MFSAHLYTILLDHVVAALRVCWHVAGPCICGLYLDGVLPNSDYDSVSNFVASAMLHPYLLQQNRQFPGYIERHTASGQEFKGVEATCRKVMGEKAAKFNLLLWLIVCHMV